MSLRDSFKTSSLEMLVLALLRSGDKYGYEISHLIGDRGAIASAPHSKAAAHHKKA